MINRAIQEIFKRTLIYGEDFLWTGKPGLTAFLRPRYPFIVTSLLFCVLVNFLPKMTHGWHPDRMTIVASLLPLMIVTLQEVFMALLWRSTFYAITNKRIMISSGFPFPIISTVDMAKIKRLELDAGIFSNSKQGTLLIRTEGNEDADLVDIQNPGQVHQLIQQELVRVRSSASGGSPEKKFEKPEMVSRALPLEKVEQFNDVKEAGELIYWIAKPAIGPYLLKDAAGIAFVIGWFLILFYYKTVFAISGPTSYRPSVIFALMLFSAPIWVGCLYLVHRIFKSLSTSYAYSDKRMIVKSRKNLKQVYYNDIGVIEVSVSNVEARTGTGTLSVYSLNVDKDQKRIECHFVAIKNPYGVCRGIKRQMLLNKRGIR